MFNNGNIVMIHGAQIGIVMGYQGRAWGDNVYDIQVSPRQTWGVFEHHLILLEKGKR